MIKRNIDLFIINTSAVLVGILFYYLIDKKIELSIAIIAGGLSLAFGLRQYKIENDKIFKELFTMFNEKYDKKFNDTLNKIDIEFKSKGKYDLSIEEKKLVIDYFNLCAEEYLWYTKERIDEEVWNAWEIGIKYFINLEPIRKVAKSEREVKESYYGLFEKLDINFLDEK
ncbi:MAG TPA: hypothetical protein VKB19_10275 [Pedobacter sp.]|nr:hypothetical protein [Pedobacter sp.]